MIELASVLFMLLILMFIVVATHDILMQSFKYIPDMKDYV
jgi:hypothetical protein